MTRPIQISEPALQPTKLWSPVQKWPTRCPAPFFGDKSGGRSLRDHDDYDDSYKERRRDTCDPYAAPSELLPISWTAG
jgi:hypothetical protein